MLCIWNLQFQRESSPYNNLKYKYYTRGAYMSNREEVGDGEDKPWRGRNAGPENRDGEDDQRGEKTQQVIHT